MRHMSVVRHHTSVVGHHTSVVGHHTAFWSVLFAKLVLRGLHASVCDWVKPFRANVIRCRVV